MAITAVVRESLADYAHNAWSGWMKYMFEKSTKNLDGSVTIPASLVERWMRQMETSYPMLPENEQQSDLIEADKMLEIADPLSKILVDAVQAIFRNPYGCTLCDSGIPRNPAKGHQPDCPYEIAHLIVDDLTGETHIVAKE